MRFALFYHSLISDWNHGNAHFLRGVVAELLDRGHAVEVYEPEDSWSVQNLVARRGPKAVDEFHRAFPSLRSRRYRARDLDLAEALEGVDVVIVHEWNDPELVASIGRLRAASGGFVLLFHDTHHRGMSRPGEIDRYDLSSYDAVLAFGRVLLDLYEERGWARRGFVWHEAADTRTFKPLENVVPERDLVWIGNWGDGERSRELREFLVDPSRALGLTGSVHGVRYPPAALEEIVAAGLSYEGWIPNHAVPEVFARHRVTLHVPRQPYVRKLPGIPTIRVFEALACGIPLVCAPWDDSEGLFEPGRDYLVARDGQEMTSLLKEVLNDEDLARSLAAHGLHTIRARHSCSHRVDELLEICEELP